MDLDPALTRRLLRACEAQVAKVTESERPAWEAGRELFASLAAGTATQGWVRVADGAPVENVRVVPRWKLALARLRGRLRGWTGGGRT
jgi:anti-sigma factor RsiW